MSQHLASCLLLVLADLHASGHLQLVYEGVQSCQDFSTTRLHGYLRMLMCANSCWYFNSSLKGIPNLEFALITKTWQGDTNRETYTTCRVHAWGRAQINLSLSHHITWVTLGSSHIPPNDRMLGVCCFSAMNTDSSLCHSPQFLGADQSDDCLSAWRRMGFSDAQKRPLNGSVVSKPQASVLLL